MIELMLLQITQLYIRRKSVLIKAPWRTIAQHAVVAMFENFHQGVSIEKIVEKM
jgi:hypothetical protein